MLSATEDHDFLPSTSTSSANASLTTPTQASQLKQGGYILLKQHPCRIIKMSTSAPGKHGHAKVAITGIDTFTGKKYEDISPAHANVDVPVVVKREYLVLDIDGGYLSLWDREKGDTKDDVRVPEGETGKKVEEMWKRGGKDLWVMVLAAMGIEMVEGVKEVETE